MPATYDAYPTSAEVEELLTEAGMDLPAGFDTEMYAYAAAQEWEQQTRYKPFLAGEEGAYLYDPPGPNRTYESRGGSRRLFLDRGFVSIETVKSGVSETEPGTELVLGTDYRLWPANAAIDLQPYTAIDFIGARWGSPHSIEVTGIPGYCEELPADVWAAIRKLAAGYALIGIREDLASGAISWKDGDVEERGSVELALTLGEPWRKQGLAAAMRYRRMT